MLQQKEAALKAATSKEKRLVETARRAEADAVRSPLSRFHDLGVSHL